MVKNAGNKLREAMEKHHAGSVRAGNDFDLLVALRADLPGAVRAVPGDGTFARQEDFRSQAESSVLARRCADETLGHQEHGEGRRPDPAAW